MRDAIASPSHAGRMCQWREWSNGHGSNEPPFAINCKLPLCCKSSDRAQRGHDQCPMVNACVRPVGFGGCSALETGNPVTKVVVGLSRQVGGLPTCSDMPSEQEGLASHNR